ncbi:MAG: hypothetical protein FMNOHCHN_03741 [Ignavibacteriaceae bacterium]|nr:hypothetical protein [Ignavibacteriaceae bacterium]
MLDAIDASGSETSQATSVEYLDKASVLIEWTGTPSGDITIEALASDSGDWFEVQFAAPITVPGTSSEHHIIFNELPFKSIRVIWTPGMASSGTITATILAKVVGA